MYPGDVRRGGRRRSGRGTCRGPGGARRSGRRRPPGRPRARRGWVRGTSHSPASGPARRPRSVRPSRRCSGTGSRSCRPRRRLVCAHEKTPHTGGVAARAWWAQRGCGRSSNLVTASGYRSGVGRGRDGDAVLHRRHEARTRARCRSAQLQASVVDPAQPHDGEVVEIALDDPPRPTPTLSGHQVRPPPDVPGGGSSRGRNSSPFTGCSSYLGVATVFPCRSRWRSSEQNQRADRSARSVQLALV